MTDHAELIERLLGVHHATLDWAEDFRRVGSLDGEASEKARAELLKSAATAIAALMAENARLREALKPFAEAADDYRYGDPGHHGVVFISDLRRARAALAQEPRNV